MTRFPLNLAAGLALILTLATPTSAAPRQMEALNRGLVAVKQPDGTVYVSWRLLGSDPSDTAFNLYRFTDQQEPVRLNDTPIADTTHFIDDEAQPGKIQHYAVRVVSKGEEASHSVPARAWETNHLRIPIQPIEGYRPGDASVGDLDGDGDYEIVLHQVSGGRDNSFVGITGAPVLDAYELDGTHLWRINLGINIRDGEHYTQFMVYDLDGDGRAEVACKTADGTRDGRGTVLGDSTKDWRNMETNSLKFGRVLDGPEFLTIFDGRTGAALETVDYIPSRNPIDGWGGIGGNGGNDSYGNRCDRFLACVAYLDGERPSLVMCRGVYGRIVLAAWDWRGGGLTNRWVFDSGISRPPFKEASPYSGMGGHSISVADVDGDGRDEVVYQAMTVDDDGTGLYSTGRRHGDSMHVTDLYPDRPGLEVFLITENEDDTVAFQTPGVGVHDAQTGEALWSDLPGIDVRQGLAADIDPRHRGHEVWTERGDLRGSDGQRLGRAPRTTGWALWWDGDLLRELLGRSAVTKWDWEQEEEQELMPLPTRTAGRSWRRFRVTTNLIGDLLGDWREEILLTAPSGDALLLYTTTIPTPHRFTTLMHDSQYRLGIAWQNVVYNKPPHPSFYLGDGMTPPVSSEIRVVTRSGTAP